MSKIDVDFGGRLGLILGYLGPPWGGLLALRVAFGRPKLLPKPASRRFFVKKVIFHGILRFPMVFDGFSPPHGPLKVAKSAPRGVLERLGSLFWALDWSLRFGMLFGSVWVSFWVPKCPP